MLSDKQLLGCIHESYANNESRIFLLPYNIYIMGYEQLFSISYKKAPYETRTHTKRVLHIIPKPSTTSAKQTH